MSLDLAVRHALQNPIKSRGRTSISRFAAILTDGYRTSVGFNSYKTSTFQARFANKVGEPLKIHVHAELAAIKRAMGYEIWGSETDLSRFKMYVARVLADGSPANARPCRICLAAITEFGIKHVEWTE